jgi:hypothetical protein
MNNVSVQIEGFHATTGTVVQSTADFITLLQMHKMLLKAFPAEMHAFQFPPKKVSKPCVGYVITLFIPLFFFSALWREKQPKCKRVPAAAARVFEWNMCCGQHCVLIHCAGCAAPPGTRVVLRFDWLPIYH